ncbi:hypothetical protein [Streptomyces solincola]|uniref:hypothetical protein n=1 Tax=Streptomyces solincola TaxID=2100817 RepID=UPI0011B1F3ED|nr:hypothetical protein [Streptomyces solincola]
MTGGSSWESTHAGEPRPGHALAGGLDHNELGYRHAVKGQVLWFALPGPYNRSGQDMEITGGEIVDLPAGLKALDYGVFDIRDTGGTPLLAAEGAPHMPDFARLKDYSSGFTVQPGGYGHHVPMVRLLVTGKVTEDVELCRYTYRQGKLRYSQLIGCGLELRVGK